MVSDPNLDFKQSSSRYSSTSNIELYLQWQTDRKLSGMGSTRTVLELVHEDCPRARGQSSRTQNRGLGFGLGLLTVLALALTLASKWSDLGLGLDASASSHRSVINVLNL